MNDEQLEKILAESQPPKPSSRLDERVMVSYRKITGQPLWHKVLRARIQVPAPLAFLFAGAVLAILLWRFPQSGMPAPPIKVSVPVPVPVLEAAGCPEPSQQATHRRRQPARSGTRPRALANLAWTPVSHPEWRIVQ